MTAAHPIDHAWISQGRTGAQNYDEFADDAEITAVLEDNPHSALSIEMPHRAPQADGASFTQSLPAAKARLIKNQAQGEYRQHHNVVAAYRITTPEGSSSHGVFAMVDTSEISTAADEPGRVIRNEDVFVAKVAERVALIEATRHLLSAVLLIQTERADDLHEELVLVCNSSGAPDVTDVDPAGRTHEVWVVSDPDAAQRICDLAGEGELVVADGNHRSLAAQQAGLPRFLAVITTSSSLSLLPYHRLLTDIPAQGPGIVAALRAAGVQLRVLKGPVTEPDTPGTIHLYTDGTGYALESPKASTAGEGLDISTMDHAFVESVLIREVLGWEPADPRITYVGGDYSAAWLCAAVDQGRASAAVLIAAVSVEDFVAVNVNRSAMPRKSTWFVPKARAGLVLADLR